MDETTPAVATAPAAAPQTFGQHFPFKAKPEGWVDQALAAVTDKEFSALSDEDKAYLEDLHRQREINGDRRSMGGADLNRVRDIDARLSAKR